MLVQVRLNGVLTSAFGRTRLSLELPGESTVGDLLGRLREEAPAAANALAAAVAVIDGRHAGPAELLDPAREVALLMPIAGGST